MIRRIALGACALLALGAGDAVGQDIDDLDEGVALETPFEPGIESGVWELGVQIGYIDFSSRLFGSENVIVDLEDPQQAIFADMEIRGESSFQPLVRISRTFGEHFVFENAIGFAIGDYEQTISSDITKWKSREGSNELTEKEYEAGSYFMWRHEHSIVYYPRGRGAVQPYVTGGVGTNHLAVDSAYVEGGSGALAFSYGAGIRWVADELFSLTLEVRNYHTSIQFDVAQEYQELPNLNADGLVSFPTATLTDIGNMTDDEIEGIIDRLELRENFGFDENDTGATMREAILDPENELPRTLPTPVESFDEESYSSLWISLGFVAAF